LTVKEAAARLEVSTASVYLLCKAGKLPHRRLGLHSGAVRISEEDLNVYLEACKSRPPAEQPAGDAAPERKRRPRKPSGHEWPGPRYV
jgi:excisionase family DNA binding protein